MDIEVGARPQSSSLLQRAKFTHPCCLIVHIFLLPFQKHLNWNLTYFFTCLKSVMSSHPKTCSYLLKSFHKDTIVNLFSSLACDSSWHIKADSFYLSVHSTKCAREWGRRIKIVGCQRCTMHHDEGIMGAGDQGQIWERNRGNKEQDRGGRRKWQQEKRDKRGKNTGFFWVIFKRSNSHRNSRGWVTEWLFYYVADWPQPSNIWTCMCGSFLQAPLLIISVLLVTFSFSHSAFSLSFSKNTLYLDTSLFVFLHTKPVCVSRGIKEKKITLDATWTCHSDCYSFDSIIINFVIICAWYCDFVVWILCRGVYSCCGCLFLSAPAI